MEQLRYDENGLVTVVAQQYDTREVLMVAWADADAIAQTLRTGWGTYFSRSRGERWRKGATSGHVQRVVRVSIDCDADTVLYEVDQTGPACHTGTRSCFERVVFTADTQEADEAAGTVTDGTGTDGTDGTDSTDSTDSTEPVTPAVVA